jgi:preprotein translocase SecE subunit
VAEEPAQTKHRLKKTESTREKAEKATAAENSKGNSQPRRLRVHTRRVAAPFRIVGRFLGRISRFIVPPYFRNSWRELRAVTWPKMRVSFKLTFAVIVFAVVFGTVVAVVDYGLDKVFKQVLLK